MCSDCKRCEIHKNGSMTCHMEDQYEFYTEYYKKGVKVTMCTLKQTR